MKKLNLILENGQNVQIEVDPNFFHLVGENDTIVLNNKVLNSIHSLQRNNEEVLENDIQIIANATAILMRQLVNHTDRNNEHERDEAERIISAAYDLSLLHESLQEFRTQKKLPY